MLGGSARPGGDCLVGGDGRLVGCGAGATLADVGFRVSAARQPADRKSIATSAKNTSKAGKRAHKTAATSSLSSLRVMGAYTLSVVTATAR